MVRGALLDIEPRLRKVKGYRHLPQLRIAIQKDMERQKVEQKQTKEAARQGTLVLFPAGVIEEHGPHLPLAVDVYGSYLQSRMVKSELEKRGIKSLIAPAFYWGINVATGSFGGSFSC